MIDLNPTIKARVIADSVNTAGVRLTTMEWIYPRMFHSEVMTHRALSRNAGSSRAIPVATQMRRVKEGAACPIHWTANTPGMTARVELEGDALAEVVELWAEAAESALGYAQRMTDLGAHKALVNRIFEAFTHITVLVSATDWANLFELRDHEAALPEFMLLAQEVKAALAGSVPVLRPDCFERWGTQESWHLPLVTAEERDAYRVQHLVKFSTARCARVSLQNHDGTDPDPDKDRSLHDTLVGSRPIHASPTEHPAVSRGSSARFANFRGWDQYRSMVEFEQGKPIDKPYDGPTVPA